MRMCKRKIFLVFLICAVLLPALTGTGFCWGKKELNTETSAVKLFREVERGGYKVVTTEELKGRPVTRKIIFPGRCSFCFPSRR